MKTLSDRILKLMNLEIIGEFLYFDKNSYL